MNTTVANPLAVAYAVGGGVWCLLMITGGVLLLLEAAICRTAYGLLTHAVDCRLEVSDYSDASDTLLGRWLPTPRMIQLLAVYELRGFSSTGCSVSAVTRAQEVTENLGPGSPERETVGESLGNLVAHRFQSLADLVQRRIFVDRVRGILFEEHNASDTKLKGSSTSNGNPT